MIQGRNIILMAVQWIGEGRPCIKIFKYSHNRKNALEQIRKWKRGSGWC